MAAAVVPTIHWTTFFCFEWGNAADPSFFCRSCFFLEMGNMGNRSGAINIFGLMRMEAQAEESQKTGQRAKLLQRAWTHVVHWFSQNNRTS